MRNLHTTVVPISSQLLFDLLLKWRQWPASSFVPRIRRRRRRTVVSYRWLGLLPVVSMELVYESLDRHIVYRVVGGLGAGGYHSFLINYTGDDTSKSRLSIFTALPKHAPFPAGFHDQINRDIYRKLVFMADAWG